MALLLRLLHGLQTSSVNRKHRIGAAIVFSLGLIIVVVAIVRVVEIKATTEHVDPVWLALWSMIEASVGKPSTYLIYSSSCPSFINLTYTPTLQLLSFPHRQLLPSSALNLTEIPPLTPLPSNSSSSILPPVLPHPPPRPLTLLLLLPPPHPRLLCSPNSSHSIAIATPKTPFLRPHTRSLLETLFLHYSGNYSGNSFHGVHHSRRPSSPSPRLHSSC